MGNRTFCFAVFFVFLCQQVSFVEGQIVSSSPEYSINLKEGWSRVEYSDRKHTFYDTTGQYKSVVSIVQSGIDTSVYESGDEWSRTSFIAYKLFVEYSADPTGAVIYYDTSSSMLQREGLWAPEAYTLFFTSDTSHGGGWAEYIRFMSNGINGYEIYAIGDTTDMANNIAVYMEIMDSLRVPISASTSIRHSGYNTDGWRYKYLNMPASEKVHGIYDLRGRFITQQTFHSKRRTVGSGVYIDPEGRRTVELR